DELAPNTCRLRGLVALFAARGPAQQEPCPLVLVTRLDDPSLDALSRSPVAIEEFEHEARSRIDEARERELDDLFREIRPQRFVIEIHPLETRFEQMHVRVRADQSGRASR